MNRKLTGLVVVALALLAPASVLALITGGAGNEPIDDPGWPKGAAVIFNHKGRIAWWVGPPFGGGEWHAECRGDAKALNDVLADFAKLDVKSKRVVVRDGVGRSFWLNPNSEAEKAEAAKIDWTFQVWQPKSWEHFRKLPAGLKPTDGSDSDSEPPSQIDVYTANIPWADVVVPAGIEVVDQRLVSHGFTTTDGVVIEGRVTDLATNQPLAATMKLQRIEPQKGGYLYPVVAESKANAEGRWVLKNVPAGWFRVVIEADGFVPRVAGFARVDAQPQWQSYDSALSLSASVSGRISDDAGKPLADVEVRLDNVEAKVGGMYESPLGYKCQTDADGRFSADQVPAGKATVHLHKAGYCRSGPKPSITMPSDQVDLQMRRAGSIRVTVDFAGKTPPQGYVAELEPEGGNVVGSFGGTSHIDEQNQSTFKDVPPGKYFLRGHPNPYSPKEISEAVTIDLKGGEAAEVTLKAK